MRILVLTNLYPNPFQPNRGLFNRHPIRHLAAKHEVMVISPILWTDEWTARRAGKPKLGKNRTVELDGVRIVHPRYLYSPKCFREQYGRFFKLSVQRTFQRVIDQFHPDVLFAPWAYPDGWAAVELGNRYGLPVVLKVHGSDIHHLGLFPRRMSGTLRALNKADGIVVVNRELSTRIIEMGVDARKVRVVYNGIDRTVFHPGDKQKARDRQQLTLTRPLVLAVGNLVPVKGSSHFARCCNTFESTRLSSRLPYIGRRRRCVTRWSGVLSSSTCRTNSPSMEACRNTNLETGTAQPTWSHYPV